MDKNQGIYKITNIVNGKFYIGSSIDIKNRWHGHKYDLRKNIHCNDHLQSAWIKYGEENFKFEIVVEIKDIDMILPIEQLYIEMSKCYITEIGYNKNVIASAPYGYIYTPNEDVNKLYTERKSKHTNNKNIISDEQREKLSKTSRGKDRNGNVIFTEETVREISLLLYNGFTVWEIQSFYNLSDSAVRNIKLGKVWKDVIDKIDFDLPLSPKLIEIINELQDNRNKPKSNKLNVEHKNKIISLLDSGEMSQKEIAMFVGVTIHQVKGVSKSKNKKNK